MTGDEIARPRRRPVGDDDLAGAGGEQRAERAGGAAAGADQQHARVAQGDAGVALDVAHQAGAVGVVADASRRRRSAGRCMRRRRRRARSGAAASAKASNLNGIVTLQPRAPPAANAARRGGEAVERTEQALVASPARRSGAANAAWMNGDWLCATGLPTTA